MSKYRKGSHCVYLLHYHFVFIPKYRKPVLRGDIALRARDLIRRICRDHDVEIIKGHIRPRYGRREGLPRACGPGNHGALPDAATGCDALASRPCM